MYKVKVPVIGYAVVVVEATTELEAEQVVKAMIDRGEHFEIENLEVAGSIARTVGINQFPVKIAKL